jgi:hypothetical protein
MSRASSAPRVHRRGPVRWLRAWVAGVQIVFDRKITSRTPGRFQTNVITRGVEPVIQAHYNVRRHGKRVKVKRRAHAKVVRVVRREREQIGEVVVVVDVQVGVRGFSSMGAWIGTVTASRVHQGDGDRTSPRSGVRRRPQPRTANHPGDRIAGA